MKSLYIRIRLSVTYLIIVSLLFSQFSLSFAMDLPSGQNFFPIYDALKDPVVDSDPSKAKPIALGTIADNGSTFSLKNRLDTLSGAADLYFAVSAPSVVPDTIFLLNEYDVFVTYTGGQLVPWKRSVTALDVPLFGDLNHALFPGGDYLFGLLVSPAGAADPFSDYYFWVTSLSLKPTFEEVAQKVIDQFGDTADGPLALLLSADKGYSMRQIVDAIFAGQLQANGEIKGQDGTVIAPDNPPLGIIIDDSQQGTSSFQASEQITRKGLRNKLDYLEAVIPHSIETAFFMITFVLLLYLDSDEISVESVIQAIFFTFVRIYANFEDYKNALILYDGLPDDPESKPLPRGCPPESQGSSAQQTLADSNGDTCGVCRWVIPDYQYDFSKVNGVEVRTNMVLIQQYESTGDTFEQNLFYSGILAIGGINTNDLLQTYSQFANGRGSMIIALSETGDAITSIVTTYEYIPGMVTHKLQYVGSGQIPYSHSNSGGFTYTLRGPSVCDFFTTASLDISGDLASHTIDKRCDDNTEVTIWLRDNL